MSKRLIIVLVLAFVVSLTVGAYAEVQNVKVGGDILMSAINRENFTLSKSGNYKVAGFTTSARLRVDADLTDNVSATVRLLNERSWGLENDLGVLVNDEGNNTEVDIDLAYVTLKEFLYSPLTLTVGRQEISFGNRLIIGALDNIGGMWVPPDLSSRESFDAIRATLNYDPLVVDLIYAKIDESDYTINGGVPWWSTVGLQESNDINLYGLNARYDLGVRNASLEAYYFARINNTKDTFGLGDAPDRDTCHDIGMLVQGDILKDLLRGSLEFAHQFGKASTTYTGVNLGSLADRDAWAVQTMLSLLYKGEPALGVTYTYLSGDKDIYDSKFTSWDQMYMDLELGANNIIKAILPASDCHIITVWGGVKPREDVTVILVYGYYRLAERIQIDPAALAFGGDYRPLGFIPYDPSGGNFAYSMTDKKSLGNAIDLIATYDYTDDVQFALTFGCFIPGKAFRKGTADIVPGFLTVNGNHEIATQLIGSMEVKF